MVKIYLLRQALFVTETVPCAHCVAFDLGRACCAIAIVVFPFRRNHNTMVGISRTITHCPRATHHVLQIAVTLCELSVHILNVVNLLGTPS